MKTFYLAFLFCHAVGVLFAQGDSLALSSTGPLKGNTSLSDQPKPAPGRKWLVSGALATGISGSLYLNYNSLSYEYEKNFHSKNDMGAWLKMDKVQHAFLAYTVSRLSSGLWQWSGMTRNRAVLAGSATAIIYLTVKEYLDGHNANGGWSWGDAGANLTGTALFAIQELAWKGQKLQLKVSTRPKTYDPSLQSRTNKLFGASGSLKRLAKDYNAQTYWLSFNLRSLLKHKSLPAWLNLSIGMGAEDMYGNYANIVYDDDVGTVSFDRSDIRRYRQWYLAPDIDLTKIRTNRKVLRTLFSVFNSIKIPAPSLELSKGRLKGHLLNF